jgi:hypothetical protein
MYNKDNVRIFSYLNNCLEDVLELPPTTELSGLFCMTNILIFNSPPIPHSKTVSQTFRALETLQNKYFKYVRAHNPL